MKAPRGKWPTTISGKSQAFGKTYPHYVIEVSLPDTISWARRIRGDVDQDSEGAIDRSLGTGDYSVTGFGIQQNLQPETGQRVSYPKNMWRRTV